MIETVETTEIVEEATNAVANKRLEYVPLSLVIESEVALRGVDKKSEDYLQLAQSVRSNGVLEPILVREIKDPSGVIRFGLINGLQRFTASKDAGNIEIPAHIIEIDDGDLMQAQIITNLHRIETRPAQYSTQLRRLISQNPMLTMRELANTLSVSVKWIEDRLSLTKLHVEIQKLVDGNDLGLANAYALAKLPVDEQLEFVDRAMTEKSVEFTGIIAQRVKEIRDAKRQGREPREQEFRPLERSQALGDIKAERKSKAVMEAVLAEMKAETAADGWSAAIDWVLRMDPLSVEKQKATYETKLAERELNREKAKADREAKKKQDAVDKQADLMNL